MAARLSHSVGGTVGNLANLIQAHALLQWRTGYTPRAPVNRPGTLTVEPAASRLACRPAVDYIHKGSAASAELVLQLRVVFNSTQILFRSTGLAAGVAQFAHPDTCVHSQVAPAPPIPCRWDGHTCALYFVTQRPETAHLLSAEVKFDHVLQTGYHRLPNHALSAGCRYQNRIQDDAGIVEKTVHCHFLDQAITCIWNILYRYYRFHQYLRSRIHAL